MAGGSQSPAAAPEISVSSPPSSIPAKRALSEGNGTTNGNSADNDNNNQSSSSPPPSSLSSPAVNASLSTPPTKKVLERNQACLSCRSRKRKCDGGKPTCGACERLERRCQYAQSSSAAITKIHSSSVRKSPNPPARWGASPAADDSRALPVGGPPPRERSHRVSVGTVTVTSAASAALTSNQNTFTPINIESTSQSPTNGNGVRANHTRSSDAPSVKKQQRDGSAPNVDAGTFAWQFLQASPFVGLDALDLSSWATGDSAGAPRPWAEDRSKKSASPPATGDAETNATANAEAESDDLPTPEVMAELFELFLDQIHPIIPCLYRKQVLADIAPDGALSKPCPLTYAVLALASYIHPSSALQDRSARWHAAAKRGFDEAVTCGSYSLHNVQASIYICLYCFVTAELSELWVFLAKGYRMSNPLGLHQIDSPRRGRFSGFLPHPRSEQDLEERRRAAWGIYLLDSFFSCSCGWPLVVNDRDFCVNFPVDEEVFQSGEIEKMSHIVVEPFAHNLNDLIGPTITSAPPRGPYHYLCKLAVLTGRIVSYNNSPTIPTDTSEFESLETTLARFRLSLPRKYRTTVGLDSKGIAHVTQLNIFLHVCTILLHHPTVPAPTSPHSPSSDVAMSGAQAHPHSPGADSAPDLPTSEPPAFLRCLSAVNNILTLLKMQINSPPASSLTQSPVVIDSLQNPFITPSFFLSARILTVRWLDSGRDQSVRAEIELILGLFERLKEVWPKVAGKYCDLITADLRRDGAGGFGPGVIKSGNGKEGNIDR